MSWMDSWSRPSKSQATPPPLYLTHPETKYCHTCGRMISDRKNHKSETTPAKYCSAKCRSQKPRETDRRLESAFLALLEGEQKFEGVEIPREVLDLRKTPKAKGERRLIVPCSAAEILVFGSRFDPEKTHGRRRNRASRSIGDDEDGEWASVDMDGHVINDGMIDFNTTAFAGKVRPPQHLTEVNGGIGGEKGRAERTLESEDDTRRRLEGQRIANEKELVKRAARRGCVFGFKEHGQASNSALRKCEAVMGANVVEPSFAKGDWGIRWRE